MTLLRLCWSFGIRDGLALWLLPALDKAQQYESWTAAHHEGPGERAKWLTE